MSCERSGQSVWVYTAMWWSGRPSGLAQVIPWTLLRHTNNKIYVRFVYRFLLPNFYFGRIFWLTIRSLLLTLELL